MRREIERVSERQRDPAFVIVGTPRSGTTLVQRLACSLDGVQVPPETHFRSFARDLLRRERFPLDEARLRAVLDAFLVRKSSRDLQLDVDGIVAGLGGSCPDPWSLFAAIVRDMAGPAEVVGEKTPEHVRWWAPLTRHLSTLRVIAVVREPRAVVASNLRVPFGSDSHVWQAERWREDQLQVLAARDALGDGRMLLMRYEDVVLDPDGNRTRMARFLDRPPGDTTEVDPSSMHLAWEWWKVSASQPITTDRVEAWRDVLTPAQARDVLAIVWGPMEALGYRDAPSRARAALRRATFGPRVRRLRRRHRRAAADERAWVRTL